MRDRCGAVRLYRPGWVAAEAAGCFLCGDFRTSRLPMHTPMSPFCVLCVICGPKNPVLSTPEREFLRAQRPVESADLRAWVAFCTNGKFWPRGGGGNWAWAAGGWW